MPGKETGEKQLFTITIIIVVVVLLAVGVIAFLSYRKYSGLTAKTEESRKAIKKYDDIIKDEKDLTKKIEDSEARFGRVEQYLPDEREVAKLINAFTSKCIEARLKIAKLEKARATTALRRGQVAVQRDIEKINYDCKFKGTFHALAGFISKIEDWEHFKRFVSITKFNMKAADDGLAFDDGKQLHEITMTLELYKYKEPPKPVVPQTPPVARRR